MAVCPNPANTSYRPLAHRNCEVCVVAERFDTRAFGKTALASADLLGGLDLPETR